MDHSSPDTAPGTSMVRTCGEGSFAVVYAARGPDGGLYAIKKIKEEQKSWSACLQLRELRSFKEAGRHPNIVGLKEVVLEGKLLHFVFEFLSSNLHELLSARGMAMAAEGAWIGLNLRGRTFGSAQGAPKWDEILGTALQPVSSPRVSLSRQRPLALTAISLRSL